MKGSHSEYKDACVNVETPNLLVSIYILKILKMKIAEDVKFYFIWNHRCENMELYRQSCLSKSNQNIISDAWAQPQGLIALQFDSPWNGV